MPSRRNFLQMLGAGAAGMGLCRATPAQGGPARIAWLSHTRAIDGATFFNELRRGFADLGHVEGRSIIIEPYWGDDDPARITKNVTEAIASRPTLIVAQGSTGPIVRRSTTTIPVVFGYSGDPVEAGIVDSFNRPGRNLTGISYMQLDLVGKRLELLKEILPAARRVAIISSPQHPGDQSERRASQAAANQLGLTLEYFEIRNPVDLLEVLPAVAKTRAQAAVMFPTQHIISSRERIAAWSVKTRMPAVSGWAQFAEGGNLFSYGPNLGETMRRLAFFADRILKGARPAELPVELPTHVEFVINLRMAKTLGITVPPTVLLRANRVIE